MSLKRITYQDFWKLSESGNEEIADFIHGMESMRLHLRDVVASDSNQNFRKRVLMQIDRIPQIDKDNSRQQLYRSIKKLLSLHEMYLGALCPNTPLLHRLIEVYEELYGQETTDVHSVL